MDALPAGVVAALLVVGYPLYQLVTTGQLDTTSALVRGGVVAGACTAGISAIVRLALSWEDEAERDRTRRLNSLFTDMEDAMSDGTLHDEPGDDDAEAPARPPAP